MEWLIVGILVLLGLAGAGGASSAPGESDTETDRYADLRARAAKGAPWAADFHDALVRAGVPDFAATPISLALARWAGIESGGNTNDHTTSAGIDERGLLSATKEATLAGGASAADWDAILDPKTSRSKQADIMISYLKGILPRVMDLTGWGAANYPDLIWAAYVYHALPIMLVEMSKQKTIASDAPSAAANWRSGAAGGEGYKPSTDAIKYGKPATPTGLYARFGIAANVVEGG